MIFLVLLAALLGFLGVVLHSTRYLANLGARARGARLERMQRSPSWRDGVFQNSLPTTVMMPGRFWNTMRAWMRSNPNAHPPHPLPTAQLTRAALEPAAADLRVVWLGHSTILLDIEGRRLLFDPVWSDRGSPTQLLGPRRFTSVPLPLAELPPLDAVVISHDHYDHLDADTIRTLAAAQPEVPFLVPLGVGAHLERWGIAPARIRELDWWEETALGGGRLRIVETPARHFSGRGLLDRNTTLWASWVVLGESHRVFFSGDTGAFPGLAEIGRRFGPFDLTMLEIGAYHPNWGMIHLGAHNAVPAHADLRGRVLLPLHWGTFRLGVDGWNDPIRELAAAAATAGIPLLAPRPGELARPVQAGPVEAWWDQVR